MRLTHGVGRGIIRVMPSKSPAQARMMAAAAHDPEFARKVGVPQSVARDYNQADKGRKLAEAMKAYHRRRASGADDT